MVIEYLDLFGVPHIGVYVHACDRYALIPPRVPRKKIQLIEKVLGVKTYTVDFLDSRLVGVFCAGNSHGIVLPWFSDPEGVEKLKQELDVEIEVLELKRTAWGNMVAVNDKGGIVDPRIPRRVMKRLEDLFQVELEKMEVAAYAVVGSVVAVTNIGGIVHPMVTEEQLEMLQSILKVDVYPGTVNGGVPFVRSGIAANSRGAVVGTSTTGPELLIIGQSLKVA